LFVHRNIAVVAAVLVWLHALGYLLVDPVSIEYFLPKAPGYMLVGLVSGIVLLGLTATAFPTIRRYCYASFGSFRRWHLALSVATLAGSVWHIIGTQFIVTGAFRLTLFSALVIGLPVFAYQHRRAGKPALRRAGKPAFAPSGAATASRDYVLITLGCLLLAAGYAGVRNL
jgi:Sec-independent protein secretion pathway component TatC